jgi:hypothetical protein
MVDASCPASTTRHPPGCSPQKAVLDCDIAAFSTPAEAIRYAIEKLPRKLFLGTSLEVNRERYNAEQIRALYESERYPLTRNDSSL